MRIRQFYLLFLSSLILLSACQGAMQEQGFTTDDKSEIVQLTLDRALVDQEIPDYGLLTAGGNELILSSENIEDVDVGAVPGFELVVLSRDEIQAKADAEGDFLYLFFNPFEQESIDRVKVSFGSQWAVAQGSNSGYLSGGGLQLLYDRQADGWVGQVEGAWIS